MTDPTPAQTAGSTLSAAAAKLLDVIQVFNRTQRPDAPQWLMSAWSNHRLGLALRNAASEYLLQQAYDRAWVAAQNAALLAETVDDWMGCFFQEELDELEAFFPKDQRDAAIELLTDDVRLKSVARLEAVAKNLPPAEQMAANEAVAELLEPVIHTVTVLCTIDDFKSFFSPSEQEDVDIWLCNATAAVVEWTQARDARNQIQTALGITVPQIADRQIADREIA